MAQEPKLALVTGAAVRVGRALALGLASMGYDLALHCHSHRREAESLAESLTGRHRCRVFQADLRDLRAASELVGRIEASLGPISVAVLSAASFERTPVGTLSSEALESSLRLNLASPLLIATGVGSLMRSRKRGSIVLLLDYSIDQPRPDFPAYEVAKAGLRAATLGLARALAPEVRVNGIAPGCVLRLPGTSAAQVEAIRNATPLKRLGGTGDVVSALEFLLERTRAVTGTIVTVDGGRSLV